MINLWYSENVFLSIEKSFRFSCLFSFEFFMIIFLLGIKDCSS